MQDEYIGRMIKNLPVLRASVGFTQEQLGLKLGVSRQTIVAIENEKSSLTWSMYLAMVCIFEKYEESNELLEKLNLFLTKLVVDDFE
jgi:Predicted transcriptional regulators